MKYEVCPYCGCNLDHGEKCSCREEAQEAERIAEREAKLDALRKGLLQHMAAQSREKDREAQLAILRAQLQIKDTIKSA